VTKHDRQRGISRMVLAGLLAGAIILAGCSSSSSSKSSPSSGQSSGAQAPASNLPPFRVLAIVAQSGALASIAQASVQGLEAAADEVNQQGGILGHKVEVNVVNDNLDPTTAANALQQQISNGTMPNLVYAGSTSNETLALVPILTTNKLLSLQATVSAKTIDPTKWPYAFSLGPATDDAATGLAAAMKQGYPNAKTVGIIIGNDVNGSSLLNSERSALQANGLNVVSQQYSPTSTLDMTPQLQALKAENPDLLVASGFGAVAGYILAGREKLGWTVPVVGDASFSANNLAKLGTPSQLNGVSIATIKTFVYKDPAQQSPAFQTFYNATKAKGADFSQSIVIYTIGWDTIQLAKLAAIQANSLDTVAMTKALENLNQPADPAYVSYPIEKFSPQKHSPILDPSFDVTAGPYLKDGMFLPVGQTP